MKVRNIKLKHIQRQPYRKEAKAASRAFSEFIIVMVDGRRVDHLSER